MSDSRSKYEELNKDFQYHKAEPEVEYNSTHNVSTVFDYENANIPQKDWSEPPKHYDNSKGSIYKFCEDQGLNSWEFDLIKRIARCRKKGQFKEDLEKTKVLIDLYLKEYDNA